MATRLGQGAARQVSVAVLSDGVAPTDEVEIGSAPFFLTALLARFAPHQPQWRAAVGELHLLCDLEAVPFIKR